MKNLKEVILMNIHVVRRGDTVWELSRRYGVSMESITQVNQLQDIPGLVLGQALVIPTGVPSKKYGYVEANGYIEPSNAGKEANIVTDVGTYLTYISPFSYQVNYDGTLNSIRDDTILSTSRTFRIAPLLVITNFRNGNFDSNLAHTIISSNAITQSLISNVLTILRNKRYYGLNVDFERIPAEDRQLYNDFLRKVVAALRPAGFVVSTALAPKTSDIQTGAWHGAHDYAAHGQIVDFVVLMTYEWGWSGGPPMAVAPIKQVRAVVNYALSVMPAKKIMIGMALYGYDWPLPYMPGGGWAKRVSPQDAYKLAAQYGATVHFDQESKSPFFNYHDSRKVEHVVWFEDAQSVQDKYRMVSELGLRGVSYWVLGEEFPQNWAVLDDMFHIVKVIQ